VVCGVGFGATATYESQHERLLASGFRALSPLAIPMVMPNALAALVSMRFDCQAPVHTISAACASGATAIGEGVELIRRGAADLVIAGGADSMITYNAMCSFLKLDVMSNNVDEPELSSRPFDRDRDGFVMAEGAGFMVLESVREAMARGHTVLGHIAGYASNADAHHLVAPAPNGEGALRCMALALQDAGVRADVISHVNAHGTSTQANDLAEGIALEQLFAGNVPPVTATKGATGHMIGGSGAAEAIVSLWSLRNALVPPVSGLRTLDPQLSIDAVMREPRKIEPLPALTSSFGFGGANAALVITT
jgi:3-oxoacyl-[acyl-carrier-protein] synthase II